VTKTFADNVKHGYRLDVATLMRGLNDPIRSGVVNHVCLLWLVLGLVGPAVDHGLRFAQQLCAIGPAFFGGGAHVEVTGFHALDDPAFVVMFHVSLPSWCREPKPPAIGYAACLRTVTFS
jgi:hypothetical protein